jgi:hypothetical protein
MNREGGQRRLGRPLALVLTGLGVLAAVAALAAALDLGPFGEDEGAQRSTATFTAEGDRICERARDQFADLQGTPPNSAEGAATLTQDLIEISQGELDQIASLEAPAGAEPALQRYLSAREEGIAILKRGLQAAQDENAGAYAVAQAKIAKGQPRRLKLARAVGFTECSRVPEGTAGSL